MAHAAPIAAPARGHRVLPPPSLRAVALGAASVALLVVLLVAWLASSIQTLDGAVEELLADGRRTFYLERVETSLLRYQRLSSAIAFSPEAEGARTDERQRMFALLEHAERVANSPEEREQIVALRTKLEEYLQARAALEDAGAELPEIVTQTREPLSALLAELEELQGHYLADMRASEQRAALVTRRANLQAGAAIVLVVVLVALGAFLLQGKLIKPLERVRGAIAEFRAKGRPTAVVEQGPIEVREIARTLNETTKALVEDRTRQLAFVAGVAHDLRSPLTALTLAVSLLEKLPTDAESRPLRDRAMRQIAGNAERLRRMVEDLMDVTRSEAGALEINPTELDLRSRVADIVDLHFVDTGGHTLTLKVPDEPVFVNADAARIDQVLINLVSNAMKYSPRGGPVHVELSCTDREAILSVSDRGVGIPEHELPMLFEPFHRGKVSKHMAPGAGLGLSILARIVRAHEGRVEVDSKLGEGSTFRVILPLARSKAAQV